MYLSGMQLASLRGGGATLQGRNFLPRKSRFDSQGVCTYREWARRRGTCPNAALPEKRSVRFPKCWDFMIEPWTICTIVSNLFLLPLRLAFWQMFLTRVFSSFRVAVARGSQNVKGKTGRISSFGMWSCSRGLHWGTDRTGAGNRISGCRVWV